MPGGAGRAASAPVHLGAPQSRTLPEAGKTKNPSLLGTVFANNYPQIPRLASTCRPGHMRSFLFGRNFPLYAQHMESIVFGAHRKGLPGIADHRRTGHWQIATAAPDRAAPPTGLRPGNDAAPARRAHSSTRSKNHIHGERRPECQDLPDQARRPIPVRPHLLHRLRGGRPVRMERRAISNYGSCHVSACPARRNP